jgi:hypothetical protein
VLRSSAADSDRTAEQGGRKESPLVLTVPSMASDGSGDTAFLALRDVPAVLVRSGAALSLGGQGGVMVVDAVLPSVLGTCSDGSWVPAAALHRVAETYALGNGSAWGASLLPPRFIVLMRPTTQVILEHLYLRMRLRDPRLMVFAAPRVVWSRRYGRMDGHFPNASSIKLLEVEWRSSERLAAALRSRALNGTPAQGGRATADTVESSKAEMVRSQQLRHRWQRFATGLRAPWPKERLAFPDIGAGVLLSTRAAQAIAFASRAPLGFGRCAMLARCAGMTGERLACAALHVLETDDSSVGIPPEHDPDLFEPDPAAGKS